MHKFSATGLALLVFGSKLVPITFKANSLKRLLLIALLFTVSLASEAQTGKSGQPAGLQTSIVRFYPNPATSVINFDFQKAYEQGYSIQIFNAILGRKMFDQVNMPEKTSINLTDFPRGMYIYQLRDRSGRMVESGKFQVAK